MKEILIIKRYISRFFLGISEAVAYCAPFFKILGIILSFLFERIEIAFKGYSPNKEKYDAKLLKTSQVMSIFNKGICATGTHSLSVEDSLRHCLVIGNSGCGKSASVVTPSLMNLAKHGHSIVCNDPAGELMEKNLPYLHEKKYHIMELNLDGKICDFFNPIKRPNTSTDIMKTSKLLTKVSLGEKSDGQFWESQSASLTGLMIKIVKKQSEEYQNLANVKYLLDRFLDSKFMDLLVVRTKDPDILREYKVFLNYDRKLMTNILATSQASLSIFSDPLIQKITSKDTIDFNSFRTKKVALFIKCNIASLKYNSVIISLLTEQFFAFLMERVPNPKKEKAIFFVIDEASSIYISLMQLALSNLRKYFVSLMLVVQDFSQVRRLYGNDEAEAIRTNCHSIVQFGGMDISEATNIESLIGKKEFLTKDKQKVVRSVMTANEIYGLKKNRAIIFVGNKIIYARMRPFYKQLRYHLLYRGLPMPEMPYQTVINDVPMITLELPKNIKNERDHEENIQ